MVRQRDHQLDQLHLARLAIPGGHGRAWRVARQDGFDWRAWDDEFVVRVAATGATCLLSALAGHALIALKDAADGVAFHDLAAALFGIGQDTATQDEADALTQALTQLEHLGLVEATAS